MTRATVIVPTRNEASNLPVLFRRICDALPDVAIVVVDDGSSDGTASSARALAAEHPVSVVERIGERGLSTAVLRGMQEARTDVCVVMDADLSHPPEAIPALVEAVEGGADIAVGSRHVAGGGSSDWPMHRHVASWLGMALARPLTSVKDPMAGFFCVRRSRLEGIELKPQGFKILLEILARTRWRHVVEVPITFQDRARGDSKFGPRERREYLRQIWALYRDVDAWPWRVAKVALGAAVVALAVVLWWVLGRA